MTTITIELDDDVAARLAADAALAGMSVTGFVGTVLREAANSDGVNDEVRAIVRDTIERSKDVFRRLADA